MTKMIFITVAAGILFGHLFAPDALIAQADLIITIGLSLLLFLVGIDIGKQEGVFASIKKSGMVILLAPVLGGIGTLAGSAVIGLLIGISPLEGVMVGAGFGWYSLAPSIIASYSTELSAICFLTNVFREMGTILLISFVAPTVGYLEAVSMGGAAAMDVLLPVVERATEGRIAVYSFVSGLILSIAVPVLVPLLVAIA